MARVLPGGIGLLLRQSTARSFLSKSSCVRAVSTNSRCVIGTVLRSPWTVTNAGIPGCLALSGVRAGLARLIQPYSSIRVQGLATSAAAEPAAAPPSSAPPLTGPTRKSLSTETVLHQAQHHKIPRARAVRKRFKTSVKKLNLVCKLVRRARVDAALMQLALSNKKAARVVRQTIHDAKFNASNNHGMNPDNLMIDEIVIGRSSYLKRMEFKGRGKTGVRRLPFCYMAVYVREIQQRDDFNNNHLRRRRPRWKCGSVRM